MSVAGPHAYEQDGSLWRGLWGALKDWARPAPEPQPEFRRWHDATVRIALTPKEAQFLRTAGLFLDDAMRSESVMRHVEIAADAPSSSAVQVLTAALERIGQ